MAGRQALTLEDILEELVGEITDEYEETPAEPIKKIDENTIEADAREMVERLGGPDGGFIAGYYGGNEAIGLDPKWQDIACQAFTTYGRYHGPGATDN